MRERKTVFLFLMELAWRFRFSMPFLLSSTVAMLGRAWMFQIRLQTVQGLHENEEDSRLDRAIEYHQPDRLMEPDISYYDDDDEGPDDESTNWDSDSSSSWETLVEEEAYG